MHVYRVAGMIASIRGKKPHVYRVIILKQMADHSQSAHRDRNSLLLSRVVFFFFEPIGSVNLFGRLKPDTFLKSTTSKTRVQS